MEGSSATGRGADRAEWYVAVEVPLGRWLDPEHAGSRAGALIRRGDQFTVVDLDSLKVFLTALTPSRWAELVGAAAESGVADPAALVASLQRDGLVLRLDLDEPGSIDVLQDLRLQTLGVGLGNDKDGEPDAFVIGDHRLLPLLTCDGLTYTIWAASDGRSLGAVCRELAQGYLMPPRRSFVTPCRCSLRSWPPAWRSSMLFPRGGPDD